MSGAYGMCDDWWLVESEIVCPVVRVVVACVRSWAAVFLARVLFFCFFVFFFFFLFFLLFFFFFFNDTATTEIYTLSLHDALPI